MKNWRPSLDESCNDALEYLTKEDKDYRSCYNQNHKKTIKNILSLYNRYYYLQPQGYYGDGYENDSYINFEQIKLLPNPEKEPWGHQMSWIYNVFYRVYYDVYPIYTYKISFNYYNYKNDKDTYYTKHISVITLCFGLLFILLFIYLSYLLYRYWRYSNKKNLIDSKLKLNWIYTIKLLKWLIPNYF